VGAFAAKNSSSMGGLLWTLAKYALVIIAIMLAVYVVLGLLRIEHRDVRSRRAVCRRAIRRS
jgi:hypothetical protein